MCGIVGHTGNSASVPIVIDGLRQLEYRGYDSAGIAVLNNGEIQIIKKKGRVQLLADAVEGLNSNIGIGHTRWATHGKPSDNNSHPHAAGKFAVVHNGIIENYLDLKIMLVNEGVSFNSETDTEVIAHLLSRNYKGDFIHAVKTTTDMLAGSFALAIICNDYQDSIVVTKRDNPLIVGRGVNNNYLASDIPALARYTKDIYVLQDGDIGIITPNNIVFYDNNFEITEKKFIIADVKFSELSMGAYESYMLKEINEIPRAIEDTIISLSKGISVEFTIRLKEASLITIVACGTAYHAGMIGKYLIEKLARKKVVVEIASEFRYRDPIIDSSSVVIAVSQSGETADTIAAVRLARSRGAFICSITNVATSSITNFSDEVIHIKAGPEIAVAATKSYNSQLVAFYYIAFALIGEANKLLEICNDLCTNAKKLVMKNDEIIEVAGTYSHSLSTFFLGRGIDYAVALEASLKLKEISYIHSEGCPAGELKHGTLAVIEKNTLVIAIITEKALADKTINAINEVKARGAEVLLVTQYAELASCGVDGMILLPKVEELFMPILTIIPLQMLAYYISRARGNDPDKPRNLAKSVTVE